MRTLLKILTGSQSVKTMLNFSTFILSKLLLLNLILIYSNVSAQGQSDYSIYWNGYSMFNPAATGFLNKHFASFSWNGLGKDIDLFPRTGSLIYEYKADKISSGIGVTLQYKNSYKYWIDYTTGISYAYHIDLGNAGKLSTGITFGNIARHVDFDRFSWYDQGTEPENGTASMLYVNLGLMYKYDNLLFGFSLSDLHLQPENKVFFFSKKQHYINLNGSYCFRIGKSVDLTPGIYAFFSTGNYHKIDYNLNITLKKKFWLGFTYNSDEEVGMMAGIDIARKYRIGYAGRGPAHRLGFMPYWYHELVLALMLPGNK